MDNLEEAIACIHGFVHDYQEGHFRKDPSGKPMSIKDNICAYMRDHVSWEDQITLCIINDFARACYKPFLDEEQQLALRIIS